MRRWFLGMVVLLLCGAMIGMRGGAGAQGEATPDLSDICEQAPEVCWEAREEYAKGESAFGEGASGVLLAFGEIPVDVSQPAALALQRVQIEPGGRIETPGNDPRVVLLYVEQGTVTVRNTAESTVTRGSGLGTPGAQLDEVIPAGTAFTMSAGDSSLSPAGSGGELWNDGSEVVVLLAGVLLPLPGVGTPVS